VYAEFGSRTPEEDHVSTEGSLGPAASRANEAGMPQPGARRSAGFLLRARQERVRETAAAAARSLEGAGCFRFRVEDVAAAVGVAKGSVYLDHGSKAALVGRALAWACDELVRELAAVDAVPDPVARLREAARLLARLARERPELSVVLEGRLACATRWIGGDPSPSEALARRLAAIAADAIRAAGPRDADPRLVAEVVLVVVGSPAGRRAAPTPAAVLRQLGALMPWLASPGGRRSVDGTLERGGGA
jgi:AcrR family transcriptional regulator